VTIEPAAVTASSPTVTAPYTDTALATAVAAVTGHGPSVSPYDDHATLDADGFTVACADGRFKVTRVQPADGKKIEAGEWATSANVAKGAIFT